MGRKKQKRSRQRGESPAEEAPGSDSPPPAPPYPGLPGPWYVHLAIMTALVLVTCLLYLPAVSLGFFHIDDAGYVTSNPLIREVSAANIRRICSEPYFANYSPTHILSYMLDHAVGKLNPRIYHVSSHLWAGLAVAFLYLLTTALTGRRLIGLAAGLLFAAHPVHVEAVAWISSRKDLVAAAFGFPAAWAWLMWRRKGKHAVAWYVASIVLFSLATAGKLSVVVLPGILFLFDFFVEKRRNLMLFVDKLPFALVAVWFVLPTIGAQPTGVRFPSPYVLGYGFLQNLWLLTGFGDYVIYRSQPPPTSVLQHGLVLIPLAALGLPFVFHKKLPAIVVALFYWILLALIPPHVLHFLHPVTDRYLYFPSAGVAILAAWCLFTVGPRLGRRALVWGPVLTMCLFAVWSSKTLAYLQEWHHPLSVWYAAVHKSDDANVYLYLGIHHQDAADHGVARLKQGGRARKRMVATARVFWQDDPRLEALLEEWEAGQFAGPLSREFQRALRLAAGELYEQAEARRGTRLQLNLFYRQAKLARDLGDVEAARAGFKRVYREAAEHTFTERRQEMQILSLHALGIIAWGQREYEEARKWLTRARDEQRQANRIFYPGIERDLERLERLMQP